MNSDRMVMKSFLQFQVSRPGHFKQLRTDDARRKTARDARRKTARDARRKTARDARRKTARDARRKTARDARRKTARDARRKTAGKPPPSAVPLAFASAFVTTMAGQAWPGGPPFRNC
jgi:hypothetical protein